MVSRVRSFIAKSKILRQFVNNAQMGGIIGAMEKKYIILDHFRKSESPSFDSLNERFYDSDNIPKIFSKNSHGNMWGNLFKVG